MATYVVGDIQGCYDPLCRLLEQVSFDQTTDVLCSVGDLINRGPNNLGVLRLVRSLGTSFRAVLGNHDLNFLAVHAGLRSPKPKDTTADLLSSEQLPEFVHWFRHLPLALWYEGHLIVHAGLLPSWSKEDALVRSEEVASALRSDEYRSYLAHMYGDRPDRWDDSLTGHARLRVVTNVLTRLRFCSPDGRMDLENKLAAQYAPKGMAPWFVHSSRVAAETPIVFGHWAALQGACDVPNVYATDTGCVWGNTLTCLRLDDHRRFQTPCAS